jgi:hypothetical protein
MHAPLSYCLSILHSFLLPVEKVTFADGWSSEYQYKVRNFALAFYYPNCSFFINHTAVLMLVIIVQSLVSRGPWQTSVEATKGHVLAR